jgi:hypothetical protein
MFFSKLSRRGTWVRCITTLLVALTMLEPLLHSHFNTQGWEDEAGAWIRIAGQTMQPELRTVSTPDEPVSQSVHQEATVYVPPAVLDGDAWGSKTSAIWLMLALLWAAPCLWWLRRGAAIARHLLCACFAYWHAPPLGVLSRHRPSIPQTLLHSPNAPPVATR